ncbi:MAG: hypothetical protein AAF074_02445 [Pseudomonadota bacterium]
MRAFISVLAIAAVASCGSVELNEGQVRVGTAPLEPSGSVSQPVTTQIFASAATGGGQVIQPNQDFQITLISAFICDFRESGGILNDPLGFATTNDAGEPCREEGHNTVFQGKATRGEIAVLAGFKFRNDDPALGDTPEERVVYFNDDVRETGQLLNFKNLPVYGPAPMVRASSRLRLTVLELDQDEVEEQAAVLQSLASAGAAFASPINAAVLGVLSSIGETLIRSNKDDREFAFDLGFDAPFGQSGVNRVLLREGYLALIRRENRSATNHFSADGQGSLVICPKRGLIGVNSCSDDNFYRSSSWMLLRISREDPMIANAELRRTLQQVAEGRLGQSILVGPNASRLQDLAGQIETLSKALSPPAQQAGAAAGGSGTNP